MITSKNSSTSLLLKHIILTLIALVAFAANSVLCRYALQHNAIDAASFTSLRLASGAIVLLLMISLHKQAKSERSKGSWIAGFMLFTYACTFSYAYLLLGAAMGALILFGVVQISMILLSSLSGNHLHHTEWLGVLIAFGGFVYLIYPGLTAPPLLGVFLMVLSGIAWAVYSIKGQQSSQALMDTAYNFLRTLPFVALLLLLTFEAAHYTSQGIFLAIVSGAVTSAIGYVMWYRVLRDLSSTQAAVVQLLVPVITAIGGILFLSELMSMRLVIASALILGGILSVILGRYYFLTLRLRT
jgi:drug/metabolite transporter (DMT)-like permease